MNLDKIAKVICKKNSENLAEPHLLCPSIITIQNRISSSKTVDSTLLAYLDKEFFALRENISDLRAWGKDGRCPLLTNDKE